MDTSCYPRWNGMAEKGQSGIAGTLAVGSRPSPAEASFGRSLTKMVECPGYPQTRLRKRLAIRPM